jgi:hypothetical protein
MEFLTTEDLQTHSYGRFITDSTSDFAAALDNSELQVIALIRSKLNARYDVDAIFAATGTARHNLIIRVAAFLTLHDVFRRNAARKYDEDKDVNYKWAMKWLQDVRDRNESPDGLPSIEIETGAPSADILWGDSSDPNNFL